MADDVAEEHIGVGSHRRTHPAQECPLFHVNETCREGWVRQEVFGCLSEFLEVVVTWYPGSAVPGR